MRTGKTQASLQTIFEQLNKGNSVFVAGMENPKDYTERLFRDFKINVLATPHYVTPHLTNKFHLTEYLPILTGYEFRKV